MITVDNAQLRKGLELAGAFIVKRHTIPALQAVKLHANGALVLEGTDLDTSARVELEYAGDACHPVGLPSPDALRKALGTSDGPSAFIGVDDTSVKLESGKFSAEINGVDVDGLEFLGVAEELFGASIGAGELAQLARIVPAISTEETRYHLNGVCVRKVGDWLWRFAATDGHRLMMIDIPLPGAEGSLPDNVILPRRWVDQVLKHFARSKEAVRLQYGLSHARNRQGADLAEVPHNAFRVEVAGEVKGLKLQVSSKLIDGVYPDYSRVIPAEQPHMIELRRGDLIRAVQGLTPLGEGKVRAVKLQRQGDQLQIGLHSVALGDARIAVPATMALPKDFHIGFNGQYLLDILHQLRGDVVQIGLTDAGGPAVITDPADTAFKAVLMPMRV